MLHRTDTLMPRSLATSLKVRPCSTTFLTAASLNSRVKVRFWLVTESPNRCPLYIMTSSDSVSTKLGEGQAYARRIRFCYNPKHGNWLNVAEYELSCLTSQCLGDRRIGELAELEKEIAAWSAKTNARQQGVDWLFKIENARVKLKRLYPRIKT